MEGQDGDGRVAREYQMIYKVTSTSPLDEIERRLQENVLALNMALDKAFPVKR